MAAPRKQSLTVHTVVELIHAVDARLEGQNHTQKAKALGASDATLPIWRQGKSIPKEKFAIPLARVIGIDFQYVLTCLAVVRHGGLEAEGREDQSGSVDYADAIRTVNSLLERAATAYEKKGQLLLQDAERRRARIRDM